MRYPCLLLLFAGILILLLRPSDCVAQLTDSNDPSLFHFGSSEQLLQGNFRGKIDYTESCSNGTKVVSAKFNDYLYVAWTGVLGSVNVACLGSTHQKEVTQGSVGRNVYHGYEDTLGGFAFSKYSPALAVYQNKLYVFYNQSSDNSVHYLAISQEGSVAIADRGTLPGAPTDLINISAYPCPTAEGLLFVASDPADNSIRLRIIGTRDYLWPYRHHSEWQVVYDQKLSERCTGTVGFCDADENKYLIAWTGTDNNHQLNSAFITKDFLYLEDKHTYSDHSSNSDGPLLFRKENTDDKTIHILWRGAHEDNQIWQGVINPNDKNKFKQFSVPKEIGVANVTPTLLSLNSLVTYMIWPTAYGSDFLDLAHNLMIAKALDYPYQDWMGKLIKDEHTLKNLVMPGSNNAGMNNVAQVTQFPGVYMALSLPNFGACNTCGFVTQTSDVKGQLEMGYRYFGVNLTNVKYSLADLGKSPYWEDHNQLHSSVQPVDHFTAVCLGEGFENMLSDARTFLRDHPKEVVIINIKDLNPGPFSLSSIIDLLQRVLPNFKDIIYQKTYETSFSSFINKPIGEFRGKIVLTVADPEVAKALNLVQDIFETSSDNQYRFVNTTNTQISKLVDNQTNFFKNSAYTGSYKRMDWQLNLTWEKALCDMRPFEECATRPQPGFWHHVWHDCKCAGEVAKMGYKVYKAFVAPEDPRNIATIVGWVMSAFGQTSLTTMEEANQHVYPAVYDWQRNGTIRKDNMVNIIYTDASDYLYTDLCLQLITDFNEYDEVNVYNSQLAVSDTHLSVSCREPNAGAATVTVTGGHAPYTYQWVATGDTTATVTGLSEGYHKVRITDAMGHTVTRKVYVSFNPHSHSSLAERHASKTELQPYGLSNYYEADCDNLIARIESDHSANALTDSLNPFTIELTVYSSVETTATVCDLTGKVRSNLTLRKGRNVVSTITLPPGIYLLKTAGSESYKLVKTQ